MTILLSIVVATMSTSPVSCAQRADPAVAAQVELVPLTLLASNPEGYEHRVIRVRGRLENTGKNYFSRDRKVVLSDANGRAIEVQPWLPLSRPVPSAHAATAPTLADYLDQQVELVGSMVKRNDPKVGTQYIFNVTSVRILDA